MKRIILTLLFSVPAILSFAQNNTPCTGHPLFNTLANHNVKECDSKEFEKLEIYQIDKAKKTTTDEKKGEFLKITYAYEGEFNTRPSATQIYQNYANAITKAGGEVLSNSSRGIYGKVKKSGDTWWIKAYTDGSGWYWLESVKESSMRQDVVLTANEIEATLTADGKVSFYGIYFDVDKATLKPESTPTLTAIAGFLKASPSITVFIVGHTDNSGDFTHNLTLSKDRAIAVLNELVTKYNISKNQVMAQGVASLSPVAANDSEEGKARNRRVEIVKK